MERTRVAFLVYVDLDPVPGTFHSKESAEDILYRILMRDIPHYEPTISLAPSYFQPIQSIDLKRKK